MNTNHTGVIETVKEKTVAGIKGTENIVETTVDGAAHIIITTAKDTAKVGGEIGTAATGLVTGAVEDVKVVGIKLEHATADVVSGALKATGEVGTAAVDLIHKSAAKPANADQPSEKVPETAASHS